MNPAVREHAIRVKVTESSEVTTQASEAQRKWNGTEVELVSDSGKSFFGMCEQDGVAPILGLTGTVTEVRVRRRGPQATPLKWSVKAQPASSAFAPGSEVTVEIFARLRHSAWTGGSSMFDDKAALRNDIIADLQGAIDDLSMLETFFITGPNNKKKDPHGASFDPRFLRGALDDAVRAAKSKELIDACHAAGIQILCGYEGVAEGTTNSKPAEFFKEFLRTGSIAQIEAHAAALHHLVFDELGLDFDGIGFDIETIGVNTFDQEFEAFYGTLARLLAADNRILTFAAGAFAVDGETDPNAAHMRSQKYRLAKLAPNIIVRPMGYDGGNVYDPVAKTGLHKDLIDCALNDVGLHPSQFQMGVKLVGQLQVGTAPVRQKDGTTKNEPVFQKVGISAPFTRADVQARITDLYRPNRIGLIGFSLGGPSVPSSTAMRSDIKTFDAILNPSGPAPGTPGTPLQCPRRVQNLR